MGPASLKTSPPLGAPFVRKRVHALFQETLRKCESYENESEVTFAFRSAEATLL